MKLLAMTKGKEKLAEVYKEAVLNSGRLAKLEHKNIVGELDHKEVAQGENQIQNAVLSALGQVPVSAWNATETNAESKLGELRTDPLLFNFVKKHGDTYDHDHALFTSFWEEMQQKYGSVRERDLLAILEDVHLALQEIPRLAARFVAQYAGKWRTTQWVDFKDGVVEQYGTVMGVKELSTLVEEKKKSFEAMLKNFVWIEGGAFMMGAEEDDKDARENEKPQHRVRLSGFYISKYTITLKQFQEFFQSISDQTEEEKLDNGFMMFPWDEISGFNWCHDAQGEIQNNLNHLVIHINWYDAVAFCNYWNKKYGFERLYSAHEKILDTGGQKIDNLQQVYGFRLPSEAEWEYSCRAGSVTSFYTGNSLEKSQANFDDNIGLTQQVGTYPANQWGVYDMHGNVWEWCQDVFDEKFYDRSKTPRTDENPLNIGEGYCRVLRGGCWISNAKDCRSSHRGHAQPNLRFTNAGFRVILIVPSSS